ncbi:hypothetical protein PTTG_27338 [Puccinia triticina 1-1 BBBD Race 1]|uniref:Uncharacterized protein n=2 Tax=Puccinia triticina TaxID=208348 RepID=A0A180GLH9_PUCT1|nr:hypothetical protein PTTG_27338 [Puccinia triticina 1-1 BBBD Race 1]WAR55436.1 hypothetical protein PtB15_6B177 [Puccinia triticina]
MRRLSMRYQRDSHDDSDSDESFHCCGRPEDLLDSPPRSTTEPKNPSTQAQKEIFVPDNEEFYCYQSGLERQKRLERSLSTSGPSQDSAKAPVARVLGRTSSTESEKTLVAEEPVLIIKTGLNSPSPSKRMRWSSICNRGAAASKAKVEKSINQYISVIVYLPKTKRKNIPAKVDGKSKTTQITLLNHAGKETVDQDPL